MIAIAFQACKRHGGTYSCAEGGLVHACRSAKDATNRTPMNLAVLSGAAAEVLSALAADTTRY